MRKCNLPVVVVTVPVGPVFTALVWCKARQQGALSSDLFPSADAAHNAGLEALFADEPSEEWEIVDRTSVAQALENIAECNGNSAEHAALAAVKAIHDFIAMQDPSLN